MVRLSNKGFTLIELMVVISIITMLASVIIATIQPIRAQARDAKRREEIHQLDLAIQQFILDKGYPPDLNGCGVLLTGVPSTLPSSCVAVSTKGIYEADGHTLTPWGELLNQLHTYLPNPPSDPCGTSCTTSDGTELGYTYYAPRAVQYYCGTGNPTSCNQLRSPDSSYQIAAPLETSTSTSGTTGGSIPHGSLPTINITSNPESFSSGGSILVSWYTLNASSCNVTDDRDNKVNQDGTGTSGSVPFSALSDAITVTISCTGAGGSKTESLQVPMHAANQGGNGGPVVAFSFYDGATTRHYFGVDNDANYSVSATSSCQFSDDSSFNFDAASDYVGDGVALANQNYLPLPTPGSGHVSFGFQDLSPYTGYANIHLTCTDAQNRSGSATITLIVP